VTVVLNVRFGGFAGVMHGVRQVALRAMGVMASGFVIPALVVPGCFPMVPRGMFVMLGCLVVVLHSNFRHEFPPFAFVLVPAGGRKTRGRALRKCEPDVKL